jgi:hypothetical protein
MTAAASIGLAVATALIAAVALRRPSLVATLLAAYLVLVADVVLVVLALSPFRAVTAGGLAATQAVLFAAALGGWWLRGRPRPPLGAARDAWRALAADRVALLFLVVVAIVLAYELVLALTVPPNNFDSLNYHLARVAAWVQHRGIYWVPNAPADRINEFQPLAEQELLFLFAATGRAALFALPQYVAELAILVAVYGTARRLGFDVRAAAGATCLLATLSLVALEATTAQNDLVAASFVVVAACLILGPGRLEPALGGAALAFGAGAKLTTLFVWPVLLCLLLLRGRRALAATAAGGIVGFVLVGMWGYVLNLAHTGHLLGYGADRTDWTTSPSWPGSLQTALHVLYRTLDLSALSNRLIFGLAAAGVVAGAALATARRREGAPSAAAHGLLVALPFLAPLLVLESADLLAWASGQAGIPVHVGGWAGGLNRLVIEDSSAFGPVGAAVLLAAPVLTVAAYRRLGLDRRHLVLAAALPTFLVLLALGAVWNPWLTRFLLVPAVLTAPLFALFFRDRAAAAALAAVATLTLAITLGHDRTKPFESPYGPPWELSWSEALKPQGGGAYFGVLPAYDRLVPHSACVGAVLGPDEPTFLLYGPRLAHRVVFLPVEHALLEARHEHLFYVVVSTGVNGWASRVFARAGWRVEPLGHYWRLAVSRAPGARTGACAFD